MRMRRRRKIWGGDEEPAAPLTSLLEEKEKRWRDGRTENVKRKERGEVEGGRKRRGEKEEENGSKAGG